MKSLPSRYNILNGEGGSKGPVLVGIICLQISLHPPPAGFRLGMTLAVSILLNAAGTVLLMRCLKEPPEIVIFEWYVLL